MIGEPLAHDSAHLHVTGKALYCDDIPLPATALHAAFGISRIAHGRIRELDLAAVIATPGVVADALPAILDIRSALAAQSYVVPSRRLVRGTPGTVLAASPHRLQGTVVIGGQDHFYLEGQIAIAIPQEDGAMLIHSSTQHPTE